MKIEDVIVELSAALQNQVDVNMKVLDYAIDVIGLFPANEKRETAVKSLREMLQSMSVQRESVGTFLEAIKGALTNE